ncbi:MAG: ATP-binding protein, partial [Verrucomicrobiota bacterium]
SGYPASYHGAGMLRNAMWKESHDVLGVVETLQISEADLSSEQNHGCLVNLRGELVEILRGPSENLMILQVGKDVVFSHLRAAKSQPVPERDSLISFTGTLLNRPAPMLEFGDSHGSFHILSRTGDDIKVLAAPSFWTLRRMMIALCTALVMTVLAVAWVGALRRKVNQQAALIHQTVAKQVVEEERVRIAREWHDMFEQHFAGLTMLLDATATMIPSDSPAGGMLERAAHMADHSRSEARQAIWDLRDPNHGQNKPFATALEETILRSWPDDTAERLQVQCAEHTVEFPGPITQRLIRIASEAVTNAFKHSECRHITVSWNDDGEAWILAIHDDGKGIPAQAVERAANEGHFGLLGMRERALRLQASLQILSPPAPGIPGTLIRVTLPKSALKS